MIHGPDAAHAAMTAIRARELSGPSVAAERPNHVATSDAPNFESVLLSMLIKEMRQSMASEMFSGDQSDILGGMFDLYLGEHLSDGMSLGLNEALAAAQATVPQSTVPQSTVPQSTVTESKIAEGTVTQGTGTHHTPQRQTGGAQHG